MPRARSRGPGGCAPRRLASHREPGRRAGSQVAVAIPSALQEELDDGRAHDPRDRDHRAEELNRLWSKYATAKIARVWPFMSQAERVGFMQGLFSQKTPDKNVQTAALILLRTMRPDEFKLPLARILAANHAPSQSSPCALRTIAVKRFPSTR